MPLWFWLLVAVPALPAAGLLYQWLGTRRDRRAFPSPGRFVELKDGCRIHLHDTGGAGPCVWLEAGLAASSIGWRRVMNSFTDAGFRVIAMDRAGYGWSAPASAPRRMPQLVGELRQAIVLSGAPLPLIMVGHSFGGLLLRHYAAQFPVDVSALVLLDPLEPFEYHPLSPENAARLRRGAALARRGALLARFGVVRLALDVLLAGGQTIPKFLARISSGRGSAVTTRLVGEVRKLPAELWPAVAAHWRQPRAFRTLAEYLELLPENCAFPLHPEAAAAIPTGVVSAGTAPPAVVEAHRQTAARAAAGLHLLAAASGHWVHLDQPDVARNLVMELLHLKTSQERI